MTTEKTETTLLIGGVCKENGSCVCPYICGNKTADGYCQTTACINTAFNRLGSLPKEHGTFRLRADGTWERITEEID